MTNCVFTICAKNYIGLAKILEKSLKRYNPECNFLIFVADEFDKNEDMEKLPSNIIIARTVFNMDKAKWDDLSFKYNLTEFCTAIKPYCFLYLFENTQYNTFIYLDPDIYFFNSLAPVYDALSIYSIVLTPHILNIDIRDNGENTSDSIMMSAGTFNLGFLALKKDPFSKKMILWWCNQLDNKCFMDTFDSYFTDQKWINLLPAFFNDNTLHIIRHKGLNVAPCNFYEREIILQNNDVFVVKYRGDSFSTVDNLVFVHYAGYNYSALMKGVIIQRDPALLRNYKDIEQILKAYMSAINEQKDIFDSFINLTYTYDLFENGVYIDKFHRRLYRGINARNICIKNPFSTKDKNCFFYQLKKAGLISLNKNKVHVDKITHRNIEGLGKKVNFMNNVFRIILKLIGYRNYQLIIRFLSRFSRFESQIFLIDRKYDRESLFYK